VLKPPGRAEQARSVSLAFGSRFPPYLVLLRVGFTLPQPLQTERCALAAPFHPYSGAGSGRSGEPFRQSQGGPPERGVAGAVSFLWHWPYTGFETRVPDVIRHTALRSSDFPPPEDTRESERLRQRPPGPPASA
jgi:hypothetical protein